MGYDLTALRASGVRLSREKSVHFVFPECPNLRALRAFRV